MSPQHSPRVCHVCSAHSADDGRVFHRACVSLAAAGYEVHLIARSSEPNTYVSKGVTVHPLAEASSRRARLARRFKVARLAARIEPDLYHVHEPELLGPVLAAARGKPVIWDVHESYLDVLMARHWMPRLVRPLARLAWDWRERQLLKRCAAVVVVTDRIAMRYLQLHRNVEVVRNVPDFADLPVLRVKERDGKTCVFAGGISPDRGIMQVIEALALLRSRGLEVSLRLAGRASPAYKEELLNCAARLSVADLVHYVGELSRPASIEFQNLGSIGLVPYLPVANSMMGMPTKLLECMALGLPVVYSDFPAYREIAESADAGVAVNPLSPASIADAIERLVRQPELARAMGERGRQLVLARLNWSVEKQKLLALYGRLLNPPC